MLLSAQGMSPARIREVVFSDPDTVWEVIHNSTPTGSTLCIRGTRVGPGDVHAAAATDQEDRAAGRDQSRPAICEWSLAAAAKRRVWRRWGLWNWTCRVSERPQRPAERVHLGPPIGRAGLPQSPAHGLTTRRPRTSASEFAVERPNLSENTRVARGRAPHRPPPGGRTMKGSPVAPPTTREITHSQNG
jgi:hypothetical protein